MIIKSKLPYYVVEDFDDVYKNEEQVSLIECFIIKDEVLLFSCPDKDNLENEDKEVQEVYKKIMALTLKMSSEKNLLDDLEEDVLVKKFISERKRFVNNEWILPWTPPRLRIKQTIWYEAEDKNDILKTIEINKHFLCIVLENRENFSSIKYVISHVDFDDCSTLIIIEKKEEDFIKNVMPKLQERFGKIDIMNGCFWWCK